MKGLGEEEFYRRLDALVPGDAPPGGAPTMADAEIFFERLTMAGLEEMHRYSTDPQFYEFLEFSPFGSIDETRAYIEKLEGRIGDSPAGRTAMYWFVRRKSDRRLIGTAALVNLVYSRRSVEWGYGVDPQLWGFGHIFPMQEMLKHYVFEVLELNRLSGMTMVGNERTTSSVLSAGMKEEGILRDFYSKDGVYHDGWQYAMLRSDYFKERVGNAAKPARFSTDDVIELVRSILPREAIDANSTMLNVATWDSLHHMEIVIAITEKLGVVLSPTETMRATSVAAIAEIIASR